jgi:hypothetical protein
MKTRSRLLGVAATVVAIPLLLTGCLSPRENPNEISAPTGKGVVASTPSPSPTSSVKPRVSANDSKAVWGSINVQATPGHSKAEVQQAVYSAQTVLQSTYNNRYMLDGSWSKDRYSINSLYGPFASYFTPATFEGYLKLADKVTDPNDIESQNAVFLMTPYFPVADDGSYKICGTGAVCQVNGYPKITPTTAADTKDPKNIYVKLTVENRFITVYKGQQGYIPDTTTVEMNLVPNTNKDNSAILPYRVAGWKGTDGKQAFVAE